MAATSFEIFPTTSTARRIKVRMGEKSPSIAFLINDGGYTLYDNSHPHATHYTNNIVQSSSNNPNVARWNHYDATISGVGLGTCEITVRLISNTSLVSTIYVETIPADSENAGGSVNVPSETVLVGNGAKKEMIISGYENSSMLYRDVLYNNMTVTGADLTATSRRNIITSKVDDDSGEAIFYFYFFSTGSKATTRAIPYFYTRDKSQNLTTRSLNMKNLVLVNGSFVVFSELQVSDGQVVVVKLDGSSLQIAKTTPVDELRNYISRQLIEKVYVNLDVIE